MNIKAFILAVSENDANRLEELIKRQLKKQNINVAECDVRFHPYTRRLRSYSKPSLYGINSIISKRDIPGPWGKVIKGCNLIQLAAQYSTSDVIQTLINWGADKDFGLPSMIYLEDRENCQLPLHLAFKSNNFDTARALIANGASYSFRLGRNGNTMLHFAVENNSIIQVNFLLTMCHCLSDDENYDNETALDIALRKSDFCIILAFIRHKCDLFRVYKTSRNLPLLLRQKRKHELASEIFKAALITNDKRSQFPELRDSICSLQALSALTIVREFQYPEVSELLPPHFTIFLFGKSHGYE